MLPSPDEGKTFKITFDFAAKTAGANQAADAARRVKKETEGTEKATRGVGTGFSKIEKAAGTLQAAGAVLTVAFGAVSATILKSASAYVQQVGTGEQASRRWLGASKALEEVNLRIGRIIAKEAVPYMEKAADLAEQAAKFLEDNPDVAKAAMTVVGGMGAIVTALGSARLLMGALSAVKGFAVGTLGAAAPYLGVAGLVGGGLVAGSNALANSNMGKRAGMATLGQAGTVAAYGLGTLFGGEKTGEDWAYRFGTLTGAIEKTGRAASEATRELDFTGQQIAAYTAYLRQEQQAQRAYNIQRTRAERDFRRQEQIEEADYTKQKARSLRDFHLQESYAERDYYRARRLRARDFGIQVVRDEQDYQKERRRAQEDHNWRMRKIILEGDAVAFWEENRSYNIERSRAEEDFQIRQGRQREDYARELADQEAQYQIERERRMQEFQIRLKDEETDFQIRRRRAREQYQIQMNDMQVQYEEERRARRQALYDQLRDLQGTLERERTMRQEFSRVMLADLRAAITAASKATNLYQTRDSGGYMQAGMVYANASGRREFALAPDTTTALETLVGGKLNQENVLALLSRGGQGGGRQQYNDNRQFVFNRGFTSEEINAIRGIFNREFSRAFS